ncbi:E3 ubiquitin-protein ligase prt1-like protein [Trifolium pratense]|uniref:E3 ubiquitin-protein ligase prt1-like protein n=2 Tax=Trifolium pratense TaxID=57577 RepID=A0A2K3ML98_TRIPR|nr:E3 ubiquitin-protein ligase prt1-like protein [Trifolium pratense]
MYPIIGDRYKCVDCKEIIGFDLCGDCYKNRAKRPGRFNQKHTPDHKLELVLADDTDFSDLELVQDEDDTDSSDLIVIQYDTDSSTDEE